MHTTPQRWLGLAPNALLAIAFALSIALAFSIGLGSGLYGRAAYTFLTTDRNAVPVVVQPQQAAPAVQQRPAVAAPALAPDPAQQGVMDYVRAHDAAAPALAP
jgi:hypothetical protein